MHDRYAHNANLVRVGVGGYICLMPMTAAEIRNARKALGMTQVQFAAALRVTDRTVQLWERGDRNMAAPTEALLGMLLQQHRQQQSLSRKRGAS